MAGLDADYPHAVVVAVGYVDVAIGVDATAVGPVHGGISGRSTITLTSQPSTGNGGDNPGNSVDAPDGVVLGIHHDDVVLGITA